MLFFDSTDNHQKLHDFDTYTETISTPTASRSINHLLGYFPDLRIFYEPNTDDIWPATGNQFWTGNSSKYCNVASSTSDITITLSKGVLGTFNIPVYYRIYLDGSTESQLNFDSTKRIEKVVADTYTGSFTANSGSSFTPTISTHSVAHGIGEKCFPLMEWSLDGTTWIDQDVQQTNTSDWGDWINAIAHCDNTNITIEAQNCSASNKTVYYRVTLLKASTDQIVFDSQKKTLLNFDSSTTSLTASGSVGAGTVGQFSTTVPLTAEGFGQIYFRESSTVEKLSPPTTAGDIGSSGGTLTVRFQYEYAPTLLTIRALVNNTGGGGVTLTSKTFNFRYALFRRT